MAQLGSEQLGGRRSDPLPTVTLILGGARSGKSRYAERLIEDRLVENRLVEDRLAGKRLVDDGLVDDGRGGIYRAATYIATADVLDDEMAARVARHRARRGPSWHTVETPTDIADALGLYTDPEKPILLDCLTLWLTNLMLADRDCRRETETLLGALGAVKGPVLLIANEVGFGIVPDNALARRFRDAAGVLNQAVAAVATQVVLIAAGLPLVLKGDAAS